MVREVHTLSEIATNLDCSSWDTLLTQTDLSFVQKAHVRKAEDEKDMLFNNKGQFSLVYQ